MPDPLGELSRTIQELQRSQADGLSSLGGMLTRYECRIRRWIKDAGAAHSDVDDLEQEVKLKLLEKLPTTSFRSVGEFRTWVRRVAINLTLDTFRRGARSPIKSRLESSGPGPGLSWDPPDDQAGPPTQIERRNRLEKARRLLESREDAIAKLPGPMRDLVDMREQQKLTWAEIAAQQTRKAEALGIRKRKTEDSVRMAYKRILERLGPPV